MDEWIELNDGTLVLGKYYVYSDSSHEGYRYRVDYKDFPSVYFYELFDAKDYAEDENYYIPVDMNDKEFWNG